MKAICGYSSIDESRKITHHTQGCIREYENWTTWIRRNDIYAPISHELMLSDLVSIVMWSISDQSWMLSDGSVITQPLLTHQDSLSNQRAVILLPQVKTISNIHEWARTKPPQFRDQQIKNISIVQFGRYSAVVRVEFSNYLIKARSSAIGNPYRPLGNRSLSVNGITKLLLFSKLVAFANFKYSGRSCRRPAGIVLTALAHYFSVPIVIILHPER